MRMGISVGGSTIDEVVTNVKAAEEAGFASAWLANIFGIDAMTAAAIAGRETKRIELGTGVVPTYSRHPFYMAQQAMSTQAATNGRFVLGIGLSHQVVIETILGLSFDKPAKHMREYLSVLMPVLEKGNMKFEGDLYKVDTTFAGLERMGTTPPSVMIAALAPIMLKLAGSMTDGTITWMTGFQTIESHIVPTMGKAAADAGRPAPRVVAGVPVAVTDDIDAAKDMLNQALQVYGTLPSYRAMLDKEGAAGPADVAILGDEETVRAGIQRYADAGVTDFHAAVGGSITGQPDTRTLDVLKTFL
jgi:5,10-methylenetetrahydromethanopterin reductase